MKSGVKIHGNDLLFSIRKFLGNYYSQVIHGLSLKQLMLKHIENSYCPAFSHLFEC